jgi:SAM-dependent methyltransferase
MNPENACPNSLTDERKAREFNEVAKQVFAPIYPVIAEQILAKTKKTSGLGLDLGSGPGHLALAVAARSNLTMYALDCSPIMKTIAQENIDEQNLSKTVKPVLGDVHTIPFDDGTFDLVVSRGSWFFWEDPLVAFREILRVMKDDGWAYIGGGFGNNTLKHEIIETMKARDPDWERGFRNRQGTRNRENIDGILNTAAGAGHYGFIDDESGLWIWMRH